MNNALLTVEKMLRWLGTRPLIRGLFAFDHFYILTLDISASLAGTPAARISSVRRAGPADIPHLERLVKRTDGYKKRFEDGHICYVAEHKGICVGMGWTKMAREHFEKENEYTVALGDGACWSYDAYMEPAFRLTGLWPAIKVQSLLYALRQGVTRSVCMIKPYNPNALASTSRMGYRKTEEALYIKLFPLRMHISRVFTAGGRRAPWRWSLGWSGR